MARVDPKAVQRRFEALKTERTSWESLWQEVRDFILPDAGNFEGDNAREGRKRFGKILDAEATHCADIIAAGLATGVSSPNRPWLRLTTLDPDLDQSSDVKIWLSHVEQQMLMTLSKAEVYNQLHQSYLELPVFGTSCTLVRQHPERVIALENLTVGEYWLADDEYGRITTLYRKFEMSAQQMVAQFGLDAVSRSVRSTYESNPFQRFEIIHAVEPRFDRDLSKRDALNQPWLSCYFQPGEKKVLFESGFKSFPALCPRWFVNAHSVYGRGPGMKALSAAKRLQQHTDRFDLLTDYATDPPKLIPASSLQIRKQMKPGGIIPVSSPTEADIIRSAWEVKTDPSFLQAQIQQDYQQIRRFFHTDTFQMIQATADGQRTAREVAALEQEKVMMLGPVLTRLHAEMLDPMVDNLFAFLVEQNRIEEPPEELRGRELNVEYISVLAKQQMASAEQGIGNFIQSLGMISQINPSALDKLDVDKAIDHIADYEGVPPDMVLSSDRVAVIRQARSQQAQEQQAMAQAQQTAATMKDLGQAADSQGLQSVMSGVQQPVP